MRPKSWTRWLLFASLLHSAVAQGQVEAPSHSLAQSLRIARSGHCITNESLAEHLRTWLRRDHVDARVAVVVDEAENGASFVVLRDGVPHAARRFDQLPRGCPDRRAALGLAIAIAIDAAVLDELVATPEPASISSGTLREPPDEPPDELAEEEDETSTPRIWVELAVGGQVLIEILPEVAAGWQLGPRLVVDGTVEIGVSAWTSSVSGADLAAGRVESQLAGGRFDLCLRRPVEMVILRGCVGAAAGVAVGRGRDLANAREVVVPYAGLFVRAGVGFPLTDFLSLELAADGWLSLLRPRFDLVDGSGRAVASATLPLGGGAGMAGLALRF